MSRAARQFPSLLEKYNQEGAEAVTKARQAQRPPTPAVDENWNGIVTGIMQRDSVPRTVAMTTARRERPDAYAAYQRG